MDILIAGANGFIGSYLTDFLTQERHHVTTLTRSPLNREHALQWDGKTLKTDKNFDVIINLCGQNVAAKRWSEKVKRELLESRVIPTNALVSFIKNAPSDKKPKLLNASAIGFYPSSTSVQTEENYATTHNLFSKRLVMQLESSARNATEYGATVTCMRFGVVLGKTGGMLAKVLPSFKLGLGAVMGDRNAYLSWIHIEDLCRAIAFIIASCTLKPAYNFTSPTPTSQLNFAETLAAACKRPRFLRLPSFFIKKIFGQMGEELLLANQKIIPERLIEAGFEFKFKNISSAINDILKR